MPNTTQSTNPKKGSAPVHCGKFESSRYSYTDLEVENVRNKAQMISYPRYSHPNGGDGGFVFQTDWINFTQYGLPKKGTKAGDYYMEDKDRCFLKVPLDKSQEACVQLENMLMEIDKYNVKNVETIFKNFAASKNVTPAKAAKLFTYQPAVRTPQDDDELAEVDGKPSNSNTGSGKPKTERFKYCKMQFNSSYPDKTITTQVYLREGEGENVKITEVSPKTPTELEDLGLGWGSSVRMIVMINKLWAAKSTNQTTKTRSYGISMKIMQLEIIPRVRQGSIKDQFTKYAFIDGEESDDVTLNTKSSKPSTTTPAKAAAKEEAHESENEENEEDEEGDDNVEEEDEEEVEEAGGDEEEEVESEEAPKSKSKKATTTATNSKKGKSRTSASRR